MNQLKNLKIKKRLMIILVIAISVMAVASFSIMGNLIKVERGARKLELRVRFVDTLKRELYEEAKILIEHVEEFAANDKLKYFWKSKNQKMLLDASSDDLQNICSVHSVSEINYIDVYGDRFLTLRSTSKRKSGQMSYLEKRGKSELIPLWEIELSEDAKLNLMLIYPLYVKGELVGFIEMGKNIDDVLERVSGILGVEILSLMRRSFQKTQINPDIYDFFANHVIRKNSGGVYNEHLKNILEKFSKTGILAQNNFQNNKQEMEIAIIPFEDNQERVIVDFVLLHDVSELNSGQRRNVIIYVLVIFIVGITVFLLLSGIVRRIEQQFELNQRALMQANESIIEREKRFRDIANSIAGWIWEVDENFRYTFVSDNVESVVGYSKEELLGKTIFELMPEKEALQSERVIRELAEKKAQIHDFEKWNICRNGKLICLITNAVPIIDQNGEFKGYRGVDKDITPMKKMAQEREHVNLRLAESGKLASLGQMAGGIAHEINNPLAVISGTTRRIRRLIDMNSENGVKIDSYLFDIDAVTERVAKIVRGLRSFSRDGSQDPLEYKKVVDFFKDVSDLSGERFKSHNVELMIDVRSIDPEQTIHCRSVQMGQVLINLLNNAFDEVAKFSEDKPKWVMIKAADVGNQVEISVTDSGDGIAKDLRDKIMHPFFTTKPLGKGTGLGLSIARGIIESHGGTFHIDTKCPNTRFVILLPKTS